MTDTSKIKSEILKKLIEESFRFSKLSLEEQKQMIEKIENSSLKKQELIYIPFFQKLNKEEEQIAEKRESAFSALIEKIKETDRYIKSLSIKQVESDVEEKEKIEEENLFNKLNELGEIKIKIWKNLKIKRLYGNYLKKLHKKKSTQKLNQNF
ncbi:MAG: hypothetical protein RBS56_03885 [Candidatus Gracilibacteria bacterium]|nr:hypothetical protein [Candidatus Gracilibacteria bacterium]